VTIGRGRFVPTCAMPSCVAVPPVHVDQQACGRPMVRKASGCCEDDLMRIDNTTASASCGRELVESPPIVATVLSAGRYANAARFAAYVSICRLSVGFSARLPPVRAARLLARFDSRQTCAAGSRFRRDRWRPARRTLTVTPNKHRSPAAVRS